MRLFDLRIKLIQALSDSHSERNIIVRRAKLSIVITRFSIQYAVSTDTTLLRLHHRRVLFAPFTTYTTFTTRIAFSRIVTGNVTYTTHR